MAIIRLLVALDYRPENAIAEELQPRFLKANQSFSGGLITVWPEIPACGTTNPMLQSGVDILIRSAV